MLPLYPIPRFLIIRERETTANEIKRFLADQHFDGATLWRLLSAAAEDPELTAFLKKHRATIEAFTTRTQFRRWFFTVDRAMVGLHLLTQVEERRLLLRRPALDRVDFFDAIDKAADANYLIHKYTTPEYVALLARSVFSRYPLVQKFLLDYVADPAHKDEDISHILNQLMLALPDLLPLSAYQYVYKL